VGKTEVLVLVILLVRTYMYFVHFVWICLKTHGGDITGTNNKYHSYRRETALQSEFVMAKSGRLELGDNILRTL